MTCDRCKTTVDDLATISDSTGASAEVCLTCGSAWLAEVAADWDSPLHVFTGTATAAQREAHKRRLRVARRSDEAKAQRDDERRRKAREAAQKKKRETAEKAEGRRIQAEAAREQRAQIAGRYVAANGKRSLDEVAQAVGVSRSQMSRLVPYCIEKGYVQRIMGSAGGFVPGPVAVPARARRP